MSGVFDTFPEATRSFLAGIAAHNEKAWFDDNRALYEAGYVEAGKAFVTALAPRLRALSPDVQAEPRINGSIMRVNRDVRFSNDKRPYKTHFDFWFWHGEEKGWNCPGFYLRITPETVLVGTGMHRFDKDLLDSFRHAIILPRSGKALLETLRQVEFLDSVAGHHPVPALRLGTIEPPVGHGHQLGLVHAARHGGKPDTGRDAQSRPQIGPVGP